ncbi:hypothetical protein [Siphonobacter curvatus]|uniref:DUF4374 domain-containing protein n=1 Tax=Siphonobacter curvatus TaxID=2094562 RepID=A0A2S7IGD9_9BACT|nr:hypothetical protein [Siphonobacter curvatus]PQA54353.1 hypothetical protein C5O19_21615 [Siphonobacter curvatus]
MKRTFRNLGLFMLASAAFLSCQKDNAVEDSSTREHRFLRVLVSDQESKQLTQINPYDGTTSTFDAKYPLANLYTTASQRFAAVLYQGQNLVEVFDSGFESHVDHVDQKGTPKFGSITATGLKPTHFKSRGQESLIFNDGDGTLSLGNETNFHTAGAQMQVINAGLVPHHGAMAAFDNGTYAVTSAPASGKSPNRVLVIDKQGKTTHASTQEVGAIHGNATDGAHAVFGAYTSAEATSGGVLVVESNGEQRMIANPAGFGAYRLGSIYYAAAAKKFIGFVATKGAYLIDLSSNQITPIYAGTDAFQCKVDYAGNRLLVLSLDGKLRVYDLASNRLIKEGNVIGTTDAGATYKPILEATNRFAYIALPTTGEVHQINLETLATTTKHKVSAKPVRLTLLGFESSEGHND